MRTFHIDPSALPPRANDPVTRLCYDAREVLGAYMGEAVEFDQWVDDPDDLDLAVYDDPIGVSIHDTVPVPINEGQALYLTNVPYVFNEDKKLVPLAEPGYVALRDMPAIERTAYVGPVISADDEQIVFRLPEPGSRAAIYDGWILDDGHELTNDHAAELQQVRRVLEVVRFGLRNQVETDREIYEGTYHANAPRPSSSKLIDESFNRVFVEGEYEDPSK